MVTMVTLFVSEWGDGRNIYCVHGLVVCVTVDVVIVVVG